MNLSIIIVSWNVCKDVVSCIDSVYRSNPSCSFEIILVDNHSADKTVDTVKEKHEKVAMIQNKSNLGFAVANNIGIAQASGKYILFLNPDTIVLPEALDRLIEFMEKNDSVGICGPQILNPDRTIQRSVRKFPNFRFALSRFTVLKWLGLFHDSLQEWKMKEFDHKSMLDVDQLIGAALIVKTSLVKELEGFDERFFMYYEEVDFCKRSQDLGYRNVFYPDAQIIHLGGQSAKQIPAKVKYMSLKSLILYLRKHNLVIVSIPLLILLKLGILTRQVLDILINAISAVFLLTNEKRCKSKFSNAKASFEFLVKYYWRLLLV